MRRNIVWQGTLLLATTAALVAAMPSLASAAPTPPSSDPFYSYGGSLTGVAPGTVLRTRQVQISLGGSPQVYPATQVLYRTTDQLGLPSATVATIIRPAGSLVAPIKLLSYQTFYDGVASTCRPSYTLQGGGGSSNTTASADETLMLNYVQQGYTVVTSDYEGPTDDFGAGWESGRGTLDAIRAAEHQLGLAAKSTPVGLVGYSGGSIASEWASELAPSYAPELDLIGVAEGGIPVDYTHNLEYISGSSDWAGAIPAVGLGVMRAYKVDIPKYLSAKGMQIASQVEQGCLDPTAYPGLKLEDLLKPQYQNWKQVPIFVRMFNDSIMSTKGTPKEPLFMGVGNADGTGDGVMIAKDVQQLAYIYCRRGVSVEFQTYNGDNHDEAAAPFESGALAFLNARYAGTPATSGCSSIGPGNALTPLAQPKSQSKSHARSPRIRVRSVKANKKRHGLVVVLATSGGTAHGVVVELKQGGKVRAKLRLARLGTRGRSVVLRIKGRIPRPGHYRLVVLLGGRTVVARNVKIAGSSRGRR